MRRRYADARIGMVLVLGVAFTACESESDFAPPPWDWNEMVVNGRTSTVEAASDAMAFDVLVPTRVGSPDRIVITSPESAPRRFRIVGFEFADPQRGRFWLLESISETTQDELESLARCTECEGSWTVMELPQGIRGLLVEGTLARSVIWLESGRRFDLIGPPRTFDREEALETAAEVIRSEP